MLCDGNPRAAETRQRFVAGSEHHATSSTPGLTPGCGTCCKCTPHGPNTVAIKLAAAHVLQLGTVWRADQRLVMGDETGSSCGRDWQCGSSKPVGAASSRRCQKGEGVHKGGGGKAQKQGNGHLGNVQGARMQTVWPLPCTVAAASAMQHQRQDARSRADST